MKTLNCRGNLIDISNPLVMGILNLTPDSFYDGGKYQNTRDILLKTESMLTEGADIIDIGAVSTRPGSQEISIDEEKKRLIPVLQNIIKTFPYALISVDTYQSEIVNIAMNEGASIINDISGGTMDEKMLETVAKFNAPYILMHSARKPLNMQENPSYENVTLEVGQYFAEKLHKCKSAGILDIIIDPGFGFGKTLEQNYELFNKLQYFKMFDNPLLVGISRKSMIYKLLNTNPDEALNGTTVLNTLAIIKGANILRVHDVKEAKEILKITKQIGLD